MSYSHIVAQIEARIARLAAARDILLSTLPNQEQLLVQASAEISPLPDTSLPAPPEAAGQREAVAVTVLKAHRQRERRTSPRRQAALAPALTGAVPQTPVAISPRELAAARAARAAEISAAVAAPVTLSALDELVREVKQRSA